MPSLAEHQSSEITKLIVVADNGAGKTGALTSLLPEGYNLWVIDTDNGIDILATIIRDDPKLGDKYLNQVQYVSLQNSFKSFGDKIISRADAWGRLSKILVNWDQPPKATPPGGVRPQDWLYTLGPKDVLVLDSLSGLADIAMDHVLSINGRIGSTPHQSDWRDGQDMLQNVLRCITAEQMKANVIVNAHLTYVKTEETEQERGYPATLGRALSPKIGRHFNSVLALKRVGVGAAAKRQFFTAPQGVIEVKNSAPFSVKPSYPIETGLADFFRDVRGGKKSDSPKLVVSK